MGSMNSKTLKLQYRTKLLIINRKLIAHILYYTKNILHIMNQRPQLFAKREALYVRCYIEERTVELANYIIKNKCTVREAARKFGISKSTVHKDITERLLEINKSLANDVKAILLENKQERHIRGGYATREKYRRHTTAV